MIRKTKDEKAPDGGIDYGERQVRPGGKIKYAGSWWQDDRFIPFVGKIVGVRSEGYWVTSLTIYWPSYPNGLLLFSIGDENVTMQEYYRVIKFEL